MGMTGRTGLKRVLTTAALVFGIAGSDANAAVYEIGDGGNMERIDVPIAIIARAPRASAASVSPTPRATVMRPLVISAAQSYAVSPELIDAIAHTESRYNQRAKSRTGAAGVMQLMPGTARDLGVDRTDAAANIRGGTAYLRMLLNRFDGDMVCTIAAYNAGPGAVSKARCIPPYRETIYYVAAVFDRLSTAAR